VVLRLIRQHLLNRTDLLCFFAPWGSPCPVEGGDNLDAMLLAHLLGEGAPEVTVRWRTKEGKTGAQRGRFRLGSYSPALDGTTVYGCIDLDGSGTHSAPLADPLGVAMVIWLHARRLGLACHLERSGGGKGWHVWFFFSTPLRAADVRRLLFALLPEEAHLTDGTLADAKANKGIEVFPKSDRAPAVVGCQLWLPWYHGAAEGGSLFYTFDEWDTWQPYAPADFAVITPEELSSALAKVESHAAPGGNGKHQAKGKPAANGKDRSTGRVPAATILTCALARAKGTRNYSGLWLACQLRDNEYSKDEARPILEDYQRQVAQDGDHEYTADEMKRSLDSAFDRPAREPWKDRAAPCTDLANAQRFVADHGTEMRYCHPRTRWLEFVETHWRADESGAAVRRAKQTVRGLHRSVTDQLAALGGAEAEGADEADVKDKQQARKRLDRLLAWAIKSQMAPRINALQDLARSELPVQPEHLDRDPWLLTCPNGTLELRTGTLREHRKDDFITALCPTPFDPQAQAPTWQAFVDATFDGDAALIRYVQQVLGRSLSGDVSEQILIVGWGRGANGKTTLANGVMHALGEDLAIKGSRDLLLGNKDDRHPAQLARLCGKRLVVCSESGEGKNLDETLAKELCGGDMIVARGMRENPYQFAPSFKVLLLTNHKPHVSQGDDAIWRRLRLIPFAKTVPEPQQDKRLPEKLKGEAPGILRWLLDGLQDWLQNGLVTPAAVTDATHDWRHHGAGYLVQTWLTERCDQDPNARTGARELYADYQQWCKNRTHTALGAITFGIELSKHEITRDAGRRHYVGVALKGAAGGGE
jgi:putative DNA primase/helicase